MITIATVFLVGLLMSAFFSGSETGFYRVPRTRLVIDGVAGDRFAKTLLWASNHPEAFVATALVGNNVANYLVSAAIVRFAGAIAPGGGLRNEMLLTVLLTPVVFIFGELLPKKAYLRSPYSLLKRSAPALLIAGVVLLVPGSLLWGASQLLSRLTGAKVEPLRARLRRDELADVFGEGQAIGLLAPAQHDLALATFALGDRPARDFMIAYGRQPRLPENATRKQLMNLARSRRLDAWPIDLPGKGCGVVRASEALVRPQEEGGLPIEPLTEFSTKTNFLHVITHMESQAVPLAALRGPNDQIVGFLRLETLQRALLAQG